MPLLRPKRANTGSVLQNAFENLYRPYPHAFPYPRQALGKPFAYPRHTLRKSKQTLWACLGLAKGERRAREIRAG